jgi:uncharacterized membrane protein
MDVFDTARPIAPVNGALIATGMVVAYLTLKFVLTGLGRIAARAQDSVVASRENWDRFVAVAVSVLVVCAGLVIGVGVRLNNPSTHDGAPLIGLGIGMALVCLAWAVHVTS